MTLKFERDGEESKAKDTGEDDAQDDETAEDGLTPEDDRFYSMGGCALISGQIIMMIVGFCSQFNVTSLTVDGHSNAAAGRSAAVACLVVTTISGLLLLAFFNRGKGHDPVALYLLPIMFMLMSLVLITR